MAVNDVYKLVLHWKSGALNQEIVNVLHYKQLGPLILDTPEEDLVDAFKSIVMPHYVNSTTNLLGVVKWSVAKMPLGAVTHEDFEQVDGAASGDAMPSQTAPLISLYTALLSKRGRGRIYLAPTTESSNAVGRPTAAYITSLNLMADELMGGMAGDIITHAGWQLCVWSTADQVAREVIRIVPRGYWGSQLDRRGAY